MAAFIANASVTAPYVQSLSSSRQTSQVSVPKDGRPSYRAAIDKEVVNVGADSSETKGISATNLRFIGIVPAKSLDVQLNWFASASLSDQNSVPGENNQFRLSDPLTKSGFVDKTSQVQHGMIFAVSGSGGRLAAPSISNSVENAMFKPALPYPASLLREYDTLTDKKYEKGLSTREAKRLQQLKEQMNTIDRASPLVQSNLAKIDSAYENLTVLDQEINSLLKVRRRKDAQQRENNNC